MPQIKCLFCRKTTEIKKISAKKSIDKKVITITNSPVYFCKTCNETFWSKEVLEIFNYIKEHNLMRDKLVFNYEDMYKKASKNDIW
ncbi:MAG: YgiT-type zinc finger protein [Clostridia bacterium]|nr:YgiT-type zinc finger protein [Clostridia bacterium]